MKNMYNSNTKSRRGGAWSVIGLLSLVILGLFLGAAIVYGLFSFYLAPQEVSVYQQEESDSLDIDAAEEEPPLEQPEPEIYEEEEVVEDPPPPIIPSYQGESPADVVEQIIPAVTGVNSIFTITRFGGQIIEDAERGSGVIIAPDGYIITNQHVVENAQNIVVVIPDRGTFEAELVGSDMLTDLALLRINEKDLTYMTLGDSDKVRVGEQVLAIGNPLGFFQQTVTAGIISAVDRPVRYPGSEYAYTFIQTDALINPGNSGGPLVNLQGEIIGINTAKIAALGVEGIGLSIPSNTVKRVVDDLSQHGRVLRPHLGVLITDIPLYDNLAQVRGVQVSDVAEGSPASEAGMQPEDIITAIEGRPVQFMAQLFDRLLAFYPGDTVTLDVARGEEELELRVTLGERPENLPVELEPEDFDPGVE